MNDVSCHKSMLCYCAATYLPLQSFRLYRGLTPACWRHCVYSGIRVGTYEFLREHVFLKVLMCTPQRMASPALIAPGAG